MSAFPIVHLIGRVFLLLKNYFKDFFRTFCWNRSSIGVSCLQPIKGRGGGIFSAPLVNNWLSAPGLELKIIISAVCKFLNLRLQSRTCLICTGRPRECHEVVSTFKNSRRRRKYIQSVLMIKTFSFRSLREFP